MIPSSPAIPAYVVPQGWLAPPRVVSLEEFLHCGQITGGRAFTVGSAFIHVEGRSNPIHVSTVLLPITDLISEKPQWETMVFGRLDHPWSDSYCQRYYRHEAAVAGHYQTLTRVLRELSIYGPPIIEVDMWPLAIEREAP